MQYTDIKNRSDERMNLLVEESSLQAGLAFVMHGLGEFKEQAATKAMAQAFQSRGYTTVRFDASNSLGDSDGKLEDATPSSYYQDLEDVILWASRQSWYQEPFFLSGRSLGGLCCGLYAQKYPEKVKGIVFLTTVVSFRLSVKTSHDELIREWEENGWADSKNIFVLQKLARTFLRDFKHFDLIKHAEELRMPKLFIAGGKDEVAPQAHTMIFFDKAPEPKKLKTIPEATHLLSCPGCTDRVQFFISDWLTHQA